MCRLLGVLSEKSADLISEHYLFDAPNPFASLSRGNPHAQGFACFDENCKATVYKQGEDDTIWTHGKYDALQKVKELKNYRAGLFHVRETGSKDYSTYNAHPFEQRDPFDPEKVWVFGHHGGVKRPFLLDNLTEEYKSRIRGNADSEVYFLNIMQNYEKIHDMPTAIKETVNIAKQKQDYWKSLNFIMTNGQTMFVFREARLNPEMFSMRYVMQGPMDGSEGNKSVVFSTDKLTKENWTKFGQGQLVKADITDGKLKVEKMMLNETPIVVRNLTKEIPSVEKIMLGGN